MLQYIVKKSEKFTATEMVQMAIEGGCRWIELGAEALGMNATQFRETVDEAIMICRENDTFLLITDDVDLVEQTHVHGVTLHSISPAMCAQVRERLGAEAIIGVYSADAKAIAELKGLDIDYILAETPRMLAPAEDAVTAFYASLSEELAKTGVDLHLVAAGDFALSTLLLLKHVGCAGFAMSQAISESQDPINATAQILHEIGA